MSTDHQKQAISPDKVRRDNSNIWRFSQELDRELHRLRFRPTDQTRIVEYFEAAGSMELSDPFPSLNFSIDLDRFSESKLSPVEQNVLRLFLCGLNQQEIADELEISQPYVSRHISEIKKALKEHFKE